MGINWIFAFWSKVVKFFFENLLCLEVLYQLIHLCLEGFLLFCYWNSYNFSYTSDTLLWNEYIRNHSEYFSFSVYFSKILVQVINISIISKDLKCYWTSLVVMDVLLRLPKQGQYKNHFEVKIIPFIKLNKIYQLQYAT